MGKIETLYEKQKLKKKKKTDSGQGSNGTASA
jgi:hypothetical protein